ncbi:MAG: serine O-acetyltransferase [Alphaproteobacteria bacterium]
MTSEFSSTAAEQLRRVDSVWFAIRRDAEAIVSSDPAIASFVYATVLNHDTLEDAIADRIAGRLDSDVVGAEVIRRGFSEAIADQPDISQDMRSDITAVLDRDPACARLIEPLLYFKGFHAIQTHRLAHWAYKRGRRDFAYYLQSRSSSVFQTDIHPAVPMGRGIFIDHATGLVIGGTALIEDNVSLLQGVTLGGTGKMDGDRHPKVRHGVLIGAGAKVLGNIEIGACSKIAAGSVVLRPVEAHTTVAGVPAKPVGKIGDVEPSLDMDQMIENTPADRDGRV